MSTAATRPTDLDCAWLAYAALTRQLPRAQVVRILLKQHSHPTRDQTTNSTVGNPECPPPP